MSKDPSAERLPADQGRARRYALPDGSMPDDARVSYNELTLP